MLMKIRSKISLNKIFDIFYKGKTPKHLAVERIIFKVEITHRIFKIKLQTQKLFVIGYYFMKCYLKLLEFFIF